MAAFIAVYKGKTISEAELVAICADERIVRRFFQELTARPTEDDGRGNPRGHVAEFRRGEHEE